MRELELFEQCARPLQLACALGLRPVLRNGLEEVECLTCRHPLQILDWSFVCRNPLCLFMAGGVVDLAARRTGSYPAGLELLLRTFPEALAAVDAAQVGAFVTAAAESAAAHRTLFDFFLALRQEDRNTVAGDLAPRAWLREQGIDPSKTSCPVFALADRKAADLFTLLDRAGAEDIGPPVSCVATPFYSFHHRLAGVHVLPCASRQPARFYEVRPSRFSYSGLLQAPLDAVEVSICQSAIEAAALTSQRARFHFEPDAAHLGLWFNREGNLEHYRPERPRYVLQKDEDLHLAAQLSKVCPDLRIAPSAGAEGQPFSIYMADTFLAEVVAAGRLSPAAKKLLDASTFSLHQRAQLIALLRSAHRQDIAEALEEYALNAVVYEHPTGFPKIYSSAFGYYALRKNAGRQDFTNFVLTFDRNLVFPDSADVFHTGRMLFNGAEFPVVVDDKHFDTPKAIETAARLAEMRQQQLNKGSLIPTITDNATAKLLGHHFKASCAKLPRVEGKPFLGWSRDRKIFHGPSWKITAAQTQRAPGVPHPDVEVFKHYSMEEDLADEVTSDLLPPICDVISQAAALCTRHYLGHPVKPVKFTNGADVQHFMAALFRGLGQVEPLMLSFNARAVEEIPGLLGYPAYAIGYTSGQLERSQLPLFILGESGNTIQGRLAPADLETGARVLRSVILRVARWLAETGGASFAKVASVVYEVNLIKEGEQIIHQSCGVTWPVSRAAYPTLEAALAVIPDDQVQEFFSHDLGAQKVTFFHRQLRGVNLAELELELRQLAKWVVASPEALEMDALSAAQFLTNFYQKQPRMKPVLGVAAPA